MAEPYTCLMPAHALILNCSFFFVYCTGSGTCWAKPYDNSPEAASRYASYVMRISVVHSWLPMIAGLICYAAIYAKKKWRKSGSQQVKPATAAVGLTTNHETYTGINKTHSPHRTADEIAVENAPVRLAQEQPVPGQATVSLSAARKAEEDKKIRVLAIAYVASITLLFPGSILWASNYYTYLDENMPVVTRTLDIMGISAFSLTPLLYVLVSKDFRNAFREILRKSS